MRWREATYLALSACCVSCEGSTHYLGADFASDAGAPDASEPSAVDPAQIPEGAPTSDLFLSWTFDDTSTTLARDSAGQMRDGTLRDSPSPSDPAPSNRADNPRGRFFNGGGAGATYALDTPLAELSVALWLKPAQLTAAQVLVRDDEQRAPSLRLRIDSEGRFVLDAGNDDVCVERARCLRSESNAPLDRWLHLAVTLEADGTRHLFVDGTEQGSVTGSAPTLALGSLRLGALPAEQPESVRGVIDDLLVYARALSPAEVAVLARRN
jgi:hypothetical protein